MLVKENGVVGDVKYSVLPPKQFKEFNDEGWVLLNGDNFSESDLAAPGINPFNSDILPDASGLFIRCLDLKNKIDPYKIETQNIRSVGSFQQDAILDHQHEISIKFDDKEKNSFVKMESGGAKDGNTFTRMTKITGLVEDKNKLSNYETRPKNIALYVYIKINSSK